MPAQLLRLLQHSDIKCPAGQVTGDASVRCNVEESTIDGRLNPESIETFCAGEYHKCPSWQLAQRAQARGEEVKLEKSPREVLMAEISKMNHLQRSQLVAEAMHRKQEMDARKRGESRIWTPGPIRRSG